MWKVSTADGLSSRLPHSAQNIREPTTDMCGCVWGKVIWLDRSDTMRCELINLHVFSWQEEAVRCDYGVTWVGLEVRCGFCVSLFTVDVLWSLGVVIIFIICVTLCSTSLCTVYVYAFSLGIHRYIRVCHRLFLSLSLETGGARSSPGHSYLFVLHDSTRSVPIRYPR